MRHLIPFLLAAALALGACSEAPLVTDCVPGLDPDCETPTPGENEVIAGVDVTALFRPPTAAERDAARDRLAAAAAARAAETPPDAAIEALTAGPDGARRFLLTLDRGGQRVVTALARVPGSTGAATRLPTVLVLTDGVDGAGEADLLTDPAFGRLIDNTVQLVVAYRGEALRVDGDETASDLAPDPYRADVDDLFQVLGALVRVPRADLGRVGVVGLGRGGTVALLAAAQGAPLASIVTLGAPTDLFAASFVDEARSVLRGATPAAPYPALDALVAPITDLRDGAIDPAEARLRLLTLSPAPLRPTYPAVFALHAVGDEVVGEDQLTSLTTALAASGTSVAQTQRVDGPTHDGLPLDPSVRGALAAFLLDTL